MSRVDNFLPFIAALLLFFAIKSEKKRIPYPFTQSPMDGSFCEDPQLHSWLEVYKRTVCYPQDYPERREALMGPEVSRKAANRERL